METKEFSEIIKMLKEIADDLMEKQEETSNKIKNIEDSKTQWYYESGRFIGLSYSATKIISARHEIERILETFEKDHCMIRVH